MSLQNNNPASEINILLGTYNGEKHLAELLDSLFAQSFKNFKLIARDDNSTDETMAILKEYEQKYPTLMEVHLNPSAPFGPVSNFSALIEMATAPYLMLCDQDDFWLPHKVERSLKKIKELEATHSVDFPLLIHTDLAVVNHQLESIAPSFWGYAGLKPGNLSLNRLLVQNVVTGCSVIFNRALKSISTPIPAQVLMHDHWLALVASAVGQVGKLDEPTILYRQHSDNVLGAKKWDWRLFKILKRAYRISMGHEIRIGYGAYHEQARALKKQLDHLLAEEQSDILNAFIEIEHMPYFKNKVTLLRYKFLKGNWVQNVGLLLRNYNSGSD